MVKINIIDEEIFLPSFPPLIVLYFGSTVVTLPFLCFRRGKTERSFTGALKWIVRHNKWHDGKQISRFLFGFYSLGPDIFDLLCVTDAFKSSQ